MGNVMQVSWARWCKKYGRPKKLSKKLTLKDKKSEWAAYSILLGTKEISFESHIRTLAEMGHFYYAFKNESFYNSYFNKKQLNSQ